MIISELFIYPVKSCAGVRVDHLFFDSDGPRGDRRFVITDPAGDFITQRETPKMAHIQPVLTEASLQLSFESDVSPMVSLPVVGEESRVRVWGDEIAGVDCGDDIALWLSELLEKECRLKVLPKDNKRRADTKYAPDNVGVSYADGFPLLVINQASLDFLSAEAGVAVAAARFRPNIVVAEVIEPFSERSWTRLSGEAGELLIVKPCERCVIPLRDPLTLERTKEVQQALVNHCRIDGKIIFGQNAVFGGERLSVGMTLNAED